MAFIILINQNAGTVLKAGEDKVAQDLKGALGEENIESIKFLHPKELHETFKDIHAHEPILVGGGDGTLLSAANIFKDRKIPFGLLPFGTMNLLCKDLDIPADYKKAAEAYVHFEEEKIDIGMVNGQLFICAAMIGMFEALAEEREKHRKNGNLIKWLAFAREAFDKFTNKTKHNYRLKYPTHSETKKVKAVVISNNTYMEDAHPNAFKKKSLQDGEFGVYSINTEGTLESMHLLSSLLLGNWQDDPGVDTVITNEIMLENDHPKIPVLLDGEKVTLNAPLHFEIMPKALSVLIPSEVTT